MLGRSCSFLCMFAKVRKAHEEAVQLGEEDLSIREEDENAERSTLEDTHSAWHLSSRAPASEGRSRHGNCSRPPLTGMLLRNLN